MLEQFRYLGTTRTNQTSVNAELRHRSKKGMLAAIQCRILSLPVCCPKIKAQDNKNYNFARHFLWV